MPSPRHPARAEVVGSLLRPPDLRLALDAFYSDGHSAILAEERTKDRTALRELEDEAVREAVRRQIDLAALIKALDPNAETQSDKARRAAKARWARAKQPTERIFVPAAEANGGLLRGAGLDADAPTLRCRQ